MLNDILQFFLATGPSFILCYDYPIIIKQLVNSFTEDYLHDEEELINGVTDELKVDEELFDVDELLILKEELQEIKMQMTLIHN